LEFGNLAEVPAILVTVRRMQQQILDRADV